ncbi:DUF6957 family protein [Pseudomonas mandelii]|uniref:DUF6957 family protein n=1 Tax=Pseudomonas mandelii TaxID=75612 RepID=UPI0018784BE9|nr:hypothetical protein [Pseudomonas mandelii]
MNTSVTDTDLLGDLLFGPAQSLGGSKLGDDELIKLAADNFTEKPFCIVRQWLLLDVMLPESQEREVKAQGLGATILYAQSAVYDSQSKLQPGDSVLSDFQSDFEKCIFESKDVLYILAGRGARKHVSAPAVEALRAFKNAYVNERVASAALHENLSWRT